MMNPLENHILLHAEPRREVARFMRRLYRQGLTTTSGGNLSLRVSAGEIVLSGSRSDKGRLTARQVGVLTLKGENLTPEVIPSIESNMHLELYRRYPAIGAVVHAHPPCASSFCASRTPINCRLLTESYAIVGDPAMAAYGQPGTSELAENVAEAAGRSCCILLENHGILTTGETLLEAFDRLEVIEFAARVTLTVSQLGQVRELSPAQLAEIAIMMGRGK